MMRVGSLLVSRIPAHTGARGTTPFGGGSLPEHGLKRGRKRAYTCVRSLGRTVGRASIRPDLAAFERLFRHVESNHMAIASRRLAAAISDGSQKSLRLVLGESYGISRMAHEARGRIELPRCGAVADAFVRASFSPRRDQTREGRNSRLRGARKTLPRLGNVAAFRRMLGLWPSLGYAARTSSANVVRRDCRRASR